MFIQGNGWQKVFWVKLVVGALPIISFTPTWCLLGILRSASKMQNHNSVFALHPHVSTSDIYFHFTAKKSKHFNIILFYLFLFELKFSQFRLAKNLQNAYFFICCRYLGNVMHIFNAVSKRRTSFKMNTPASILWW